MKKKIWIGVLAVAVLVGLAVASFLCHKEEPKEEEIKTFTTFIAVPGTPIEKENRIQEAIAEKTGAKAEVEYLKGQTAEEKISSMISLKQYPDFIDGSDSESLLIKAGALVPLDKYLDHYPNLKNYLTEQQWDSLRKEDGHIYFIPQFSVVKGQNMSPNYSGEAFWIQKRVLEWAGYPKLKTLDDYFDVICKYLEANPTTNGMKNTGFEILCEDWRSFCLENPPMFLAGYPNNGDTTVDSKTQTAKIYDTKETAKKYYKKLSEMFDKGVIEAETFTLSYQQYLDKLATGNVLGMVDQYWQFMSVQDSLHAQQRDDQTYVPFPITIDESVTPDYSRTDQNVNTGNGLGISVDCKDVEGALQFLNDLLDPEIIKLRSWGEKGIDYFVAKNGVFYRTKEKRLEVKNDDYVKENYCNYTYFPNYKGMLDDGINAVIPSEQPDEYYEELNEYDKKILNGYGYKTWKEFMGEEKEGDAWYPLYSCTESWPEGSTYGIAAKNMEEMRKMYLPQLIMSPLSQFEKEWTNYKYAYEKKVDIKAYEQKINQEIKKRVEAAKK